MRVAIIGAGISGLSTAFYLQRSRSDAEIHIFEANPHAGGTMHTLEKQGFLFEEGGNGFLSNKPDMLKLVEESQASHLLMRSEDAARKRFIHTDVLHPFPDSPGKFLRSGLLSPAQKLRVVGELVIPAKRDDQDETLQSFGYRRLGKAFTDIFLDAMTAGIYGTTADRVSVRAAFPLVASLEKDHGGLFKGMIARRKQSAGPGGVLMSFKGGMSTMVNHLRQSIQAQWHLGQAVDSITARENGYRIRVGTESHDFDQVITAVPAYALAPMVRELDPALADQLGALDYSPIAVVGFGWKQLDHPLDGFGLLTTARAPLPFLGVLWDSSIFPDRAPAGMKSVRIMLGGQRSPEKLALSEDELIRESREGLAKALGIHKQPDAVMVKCWPKGLPGYPVGHIAAVDAIMDRASRHRGLHITGNAFRGIAMNDCVRNGRLTGEKAALYGRAT